MVLGLKQMSLIYTNTNFGSEESKLISTNYLNLNENNQNSVSIFPNPSENYIYIRYENISPESYKIFDVNGRLIYSKIINNNDDLLVDVSSYDRGLYFISIVSNQKVINLKFLVK